MAHPLTQHPSSALPFGSAVRPSPFGFGFGGSASPNNAAAAAAAANANAGPSALSPFASPSRPKFGTSLSQPVVTPSSPTRAFSPARPSILTGAPRSSSFAYAPSSASVAVPAPSSLKRSRRSVSPTPSSSPSPSPSLNLSPKRSSFSRRGDDLSVDGLDIAEGSSAPARRLKRLRKTAEVADVTRADEYDTGVLLSSLPPTSHLQILQSLLKEDPSLKARILAHMPTPDLQECLRNLDSTADSIRRSMPRAGVLADAKLHTKIQQYCRQATAYLQFFAQPPVSPSPPPSSMFTLLQKVTEGVHLLLSFLQAPSSRPTLDLVQDDISHVATSLIARWRDWVTQLDEAANTRGEMFPHSFLVSWFEGLDSLVNAASHRATSDPFGTGIGPNLAAPYDSALASIRSTMVDRLGWMIGRAPGSY